MKAWANDLSTQAVDLPVHGCKIYNVATQVIRYRTTLSSSRSSFMPVPYRQCTKSQAQERAGSISAEGPIAILG
jgi:hypothetical protein